MRVRTVCARLFAQLLVSALFLILVEGAPRQAQAADPAAGEAVFQSECAICHSPKPDVNKIGPSLFEVVGRKTQLGAEIQILGGQQELQHHLDAGDPGQLLSSPDGVVPGTKMPYDGLKDPTKRADLIGYLETLKK